VWFTKWAQYCGAALNPCKEGAEKAKGGTMENWKGRKWRGPPLS
jgi:hypothetical protein